MACFKVMGKFLDGPSRNSMQHCGTCKQQLGNSTPRTQCKWEVQQMHHSAERAQHASRACHEQMLTWVEFTPKLLKHLAACAAHNYLVSEPILVTDNHDRAW